MKHNRSAYSKMFLVTPAIYEKLLNCLDKTDAVSTKSLNDEKETTIERPSEREIQNLNLANLNEPPQIPEKIISMPETVTVDSEPEIFSANDEMQPEQQQQQQESILDQDITENKPVKPQYAIVDNPLKKSCQTVDDTHGVIPRGNLVYNPHWKKNQQQNATLNVPNSDNFIPTQRKKIKHPTFKTPVTYTEPPGIREPIQAQAIQESTKNFQCQVCFKFFDRKWSLRRHMDTVHKNLKNVKGLKLNRPTQQIIDVPAIEETAMPLQDEDIPMTQDPNTSNFQQWVDQPIRKKPIKRSLVDAKLQDYKFRPRKYYRVPDNEDDPFEVWTKPQFV
jgi:hypothetical protein